MNSTRPGCFIIVNMLIISFPDFDTLEIHVLYISAIQLVVNFASPIWVTQAKVGVLLCMFIRKKKNRSGTTSVVIVDKTRGRFRELITIGVSNESSKIEA